MKPFPIAINTQKYRLFYNSITKQIATIFTTKEYEIFYKYNTFGIRCIKIPE